MLTESIMLIREYLKLILKNSEISQGNWTQDEALTEPRVEGETNLGCHVNSTHLSLLI